MKNLIYILILVFGVKFLDAQVVYEEFESYKLGERREIKIQLPRGYEDNTDQSYPLFIVFDGDYMFEAVAGIVDYYSYILRILYICYVCQFYGKPFPRPHFLHFQAFIII